MYAAHKYLLLFGVYAGIILLRAVAMFQVLLSKRGKHTCQLKPANCGIVLGVLNGGLLILVNIILIGVEAMGDVGFERWP